MFEDKELATIQSVEQLESMLSDIRVHFLPRNPILALVSEEGNVLSLGISPDGCYANFRNANWKPPYYSTLSINSEAINDDVVEFQMSAHNHVSEIRKRNIIGFEKLSQIAKFFVANGTRLDKGVDWEID